MCHSINSLNIASLQLLPIFSPNQRSHLVFCQYAQCLIRGQLMYRKIISTPLRASIRSSIFPTAIRNPDQIRRPAASVRSCAHPDRAPTGTNHRRNAQEPRDIAGARMPTSLRNSEAETQGLKYRDAHRNQDCKRNLGKNFF